MKQKGHARIASRVLMLLVLIDLIATSIWFNAFQIPEANPLMAAPMEHSTIKFALTKLALSLPGIWLLHKHYDKLIARFGLFFLIFIYVVIAIIHYFVFINVI